MSEKIRKIKELRKRTGCRLYDCKVTMDMVGWDVEKAVELLKKTAIVSQTGKQLNGGYIGTYVHNTGTLGAMVSVKTETDFASRTELFRDFADNLAMHICATQPISIQGLLSEEYVMYPGKTVLDVVKDAEYLLKEEIRIVDFKILDAK